MAFRSAVARLLPWLAAFLAGCGGGLFIGFGDRIGFDGSPPSVQLVARAASVPAGQAAGFVAAASDEDGIDAVEFFRVDPAGAVLVGRDDAAPYEIVVAAPTDGRTALVVFARAIDRDGNTADNAVVSVVVTP